MLCESYTRPETTLKLFKIKFLNIDTYRLKAANEQTVILLIFCLYLYFNHFPKFMAMSDSRKTNQ